LGLTPTSVAVGDFNGDGIPDLVVANATGISTIRVSVSILLGNGDGIFQPPVQYDAGPTASAIAVGDFNGDGLADLALVFAGGVRVLLGNGDGTLQSTPISYVAGSFPVALAIGDINRDGFPDLVVTDKLSHRVSMLLNAGQWAP
jgi:hypothetical protein